MANPAADMTTTIELENLLETLGETDSQVMNDQSCPELSSMIKAALAEPLYYPAISEWMLAGDTVAILLQTDLPYPRRVLDAVLDTVRETEVEPADVTVVVSPKLGNQLDLVLVAEDEATQFDDGSIARYRLPDDERFNAIRFEIHENENDQAVAYIAANEAGDPVYVNRTLFDADVIFPVGCRWPQTSSQTADCLYPNFSKLDSQLRFSKHKGSSKPLLDEIELANDALGLFFSFELVCRPGGGIEKVICGTRQDVEKAVASEIDSLWTIQRSPDADLIVFTIESDAKAQSWDDITKAILAASHISDRNGPIVIWSQIAEKPPADFRKACAAQFESSIDDTLPKDLQLLAGVLEERRVYLHSGLTQKFAEELGIGCIQTTDELSRLNESCDSVVLVRDGHRRNI